MYTPAALLDIHARSHRSLANLITHCQGLEEEEADRQVDGFGPATVRLQLHHIIRAEAYWIGVLEGRVDAEDNSNRFPTLASIQAYREEVFQATTSYLKGVDQEALNRTRPRATWGGRTMDLKPAGVLLRIATHIFQHQGQVTALCRLMGKPCTGLDFPLD